jgi:hypothetical protein
MIAAFGCSHSRASSLIRILLIRYFNQRPCGEDKTSAMPAHGASVTVRWRFLRSANPRTFKLRPLSYQIPTKLIGFRAACRPLLRLFTGRRFGFER